jgi:membrane-associated phospholipid phosphatase
VYLREQEHTLHAHMVGGHWSHLALVGWATFGPVLYAVLLGTGWWVARHRRAAVMAAAVWAPIGVVAAVLVNQPIEQMPTVRLPMFHAHTAELPAPSDHAAIAAATAAGLLLVNRRLGLVAGASAVIMALTFAVGGAPLEDIAGGTVVGVTVTLIGFVLFEGPVRRLVALARRTRLRPIAGPGKVS